MLKKLLANVPTDDWRQDNPFSAEMTAVQEAMLSTDSHKDARRLLLSWISDHQPCLFGRMAAKSETLGTCILFEGELNEHDDDWVRARIQEARDRWVASTFRGEASGFVVMVVSRRLALGSPSPEMGKFAQQLCKYYLLREDVEFDRVYHEEAYLAVEHDVKMAWKWLAGVNYFAANADCRWWRDHRIPGGIAFSTNSVGHLVKSGIVKHADEAFWRAIGIETEAQKSPVDSLGKALRLAMQTIHLASEGRCGKATELIQRDRDCPVPPIELKSYLEGKDHRSYRGYYHTDHTLPSPYFDSSPERDRTAEPFNLDFTYLFDKSVSNPDYLTMGTGRRIRRDDDLAEVLYDRSHAIEIEIASAPRLVEALRRY